MIRIASFDKSCPRCTTLTVSFLSALHPFQWCEQIQYPEVMEGMSAMSMMSSYMNMNNSSTIQGQMWDAFRAGAMWAQSQGSQLPPMGGLMPMNVGLPMGGFDSKHPSSPDDKSSTSL